MAATKTKQHYVVMLRANGSACGCMGPYATVEAAKQEAVALPRANPGQTECVVVRANGFRDAVRAAVEAYRSAGRATAEAARAGVEEVKAAPKRAAETAKKAVKRKVEAVQSQIREQVREAEWQRIRKGVNAAIDTIEEYGFTATLAPITLPTQKSTRLNPQRLSVAQGNQMPDTFVPVRENRGVEPLPARLPRSTVVQTLLFDSSLFNVGQAKSWAKRHGFRFGKVDTGGGRASFIRLRQVDPAEITEGTFRTIRMTDGIEAVIGMPKRGAKRNPGVYVRSGRGPGAVKKQSETVVSVDGMRRATGTNRKMRIGGGLYDIVRTWVLKERGSDGKLRTVFGDATLKAAEDFIGFTFPPHLRHNPASTELLAATIAPELVAAKAAAGLAARGVSAAGKGAASVVTGAGSALADIMAPRKNRTRKKAR